MLPYLDDHLHAKNQSYQLISSKDMVIKESYNLTGQEAYTPEHTQPKVVVSNTTFSW